MKPYARYVFTQNKDAVTRYIEVSHQGSTLQDFPAVYIRGVHKGKGYVGFRKTVEKPRPGHRHFSHTFELAKNKTFTGVNFSETHPHKTYGDNKNLGLNDCVLIEFSQDWHTITMLFYKDMEPQKEELYQKWIARLLPVIVESECMDID